MGYAYGQLLAPQIANLSNFTLEWLYDSINAYIPFLSPEEQYIIDRDGVLGFLDYVLDLATPFIPDRYIDLMAGVGDGSNVSYQQVARFAMIPEAIKAQCSMVGAWGDAVNDGNILVQMRALDNGEESPLPLYPTLIVYHPSDSNSKNYSVLAYAGFIGAFTGYSDAKLAICEKYWNNCNGCDSRRGTPWTFVLQDILWYDQNKDAGIERLQNAKRTCAIYVGIGDTNTNEFNAIWYNHINITVFDDDTYPVYDGHPRIKDVVYIDKFNQPSTDPCLSELLMAGYGEIDAEYLYRYVSPVLQTGSLHVAVYDYVNDQMFISNAAQWIPGQPQLKGYERPFIQLDMAKILSEQL